jgi:pimeloyl-ACP methyl ester carboxylesterase
MSHALSTVVSYDRAGFGWSDPAPLPRTMEQRADELYALLRASQIPPPYVLVGLSYGGPLVRLFAARHAELVAGLVFVDITHEAVFATPGAQRYLRFSTRMLRVIGGLVAVGLARLLRIRGIPTSPTALPYTAEQQRILYSRFPPAHAFRTGADEFESVQRSADAMKGLNQPGLMGSIPIAVLSHGKPYPGPIAALETNHLRGQQELAALSTNGELVIAHSSSHAIPLEDPQLVLDAITRVVTVARRSPST